MRIRQDMAVVSHIHETKLIWRLFLICILFVLDQSAFPLDCPESLPHGAFDQSRPGNDGEQIAVIQKVVPIKKHHIGARFKKFDPLELQIQHINNHSQYPQKQGLVQHIYQQAVSSGKGQALSKTAFGPVVTLR